MLAKENSFQTYLLTPDEQEVGSLLNAVQRAVLQNLRVDIIEQKLLLAPTTSDLNQFIQQEAYLRGQLQIIEYLLAASDAVTSQPTQE